MTLILEMASLKSDERPRHLVFSKIERLISLMNDQRSGVPLRDKKTFLYSTVHNSFTGADFISWLSQHTCEEDNVEALHLATFLCMFGYIYPVDLRTFAVKEDKNVYYRFQSPYYWPSKHLKLTNEMYIIYLLKRNRRNKQKHGLEDYEQLLEALCKMYSCGLGQKWIETFKFLAGYVFTALTKLQAFFSDKIGFVNEQAFEQVKIVKDMKREDKTIHDLQERAFWRVHRPPKIMGGCVAGKPDTDEEPEATTEENIKERKVVERRESQRPWNRNSAQIYCGENNINKEKPPDNDIEPETNPSDTDGNDKTCEAEADTDTNNIDENIDVVHKKESVCTYIENLENEEKLVNLSDAEASDNESKDSVPDIPIVTEVSRYSSPSKFYPPPHIAPFDPNNQVKRRPRSLDSAENLTRKTRHMSYSPDFLKTKHPRSLHCIIEPMHSFPRPRPQSMDMTAFFEAKGFDVHTQRLRRILTQKVRQMHKDNKKTIEQVESPGQTKYLDEGPKRCYQPSQMVDRRRKNRDLKLKEVMYLKKALTHARMKFSKSVDIFLQNCEQYMPYDPFIDTRATQPNNPWISDDETMWEINGKLVEVPTEMRIRKWAVSFEDLLRDDTGRVEFEQFVRKEYSQENITFYKTCKEIMVCPLSSVNTLKAKIEKEFLTPGAPCEVNVDCKTLEKVREQLKNDKGTTGRSRYIFQPAMEHVYALMKKDSYTRFLRSDQYKHLLEKAQNHFTKKKFFNFGSNRKKTPSPLVGRRGSSSSDGVGLDGDKSGPYHSYSTGNLKELDDNSKKTLRNSFVGSDSSIYMGTYHNGQSMSPSLRRRTDKDHDTKIAPGQDPRRRSNLEVPRSSFPGINNSEGNRKSELVSPCLALNVPRTNVITPWDGKL